MTEEMNRIAARVWAANGEDFKRLEKA